MHSTTSIVLETALNLSHPPAPNSVSGLAGAIVWLAVGAIVTYLTILALGWIGKKLTGQDDPLQQVRAKRWRQSNSEVRVPMSGTPEITIQDDIFQLHRVETTGYGGFQGRFVCPHNGREVAVAAFTFIGNTQLAMRVIFLDGRRPDVFIARDLRLVT